MTNFQKLLGHMGVTQSEANAYFKDIILKTLYEEIHEEIVKFVKLNTDYYRDAANYIVKGMTRMSTEDFAEELKKLKSKDE